MADMNCPFRGEKESAEMEEGERRESVEMEEGERRRVRRWRKGREGIEVYRGQVNLCWMPCKLLQYVCVQCMCAVCVLQCVAPVR